jgi:3-hydroxyisobutyrate dehydrogenase-like beta-hydroxyacid dehydrogenase
METIGVIGLGRMGSRMAETLLAAGFDVVGYDQQAAPRERLAAAGGRAASDIATVAETAAVVVTSLPTPAAVEAVLAGPEGVFETGGQGLVVLEASTTGPALTRELAERATEVGMALVDTPVSGGTSGAETGALTLLVGAEPGDLDETPTAVLETLGERQHFMGGVGDGQATKLVNNTLTAGHRALAMEAMALGSGLGVAPERLLAAVGDASGSSNQFEKRVPRVLNRNFEPTFTLDLTRKDLSLALAAGQAVDYPMALTALVHELHTAASAMGHGEEDACAIVKLFERYLEAPLAAEGPVDESYAGY